MALEAFVAVQGTGYDGQDVACHFGVFAKRRFDVVVVGVQRRGTSDVGVVAVLFQKVFNHGHGGLDVIFVHLFHRTVFLLGGVQFGLQFGNMLLGFFISLGFHLVQFGLQRFQFLVQFQVTVHKHLALVVGKAVAGRFKDGAEIGCRRRFRAGGCL